MLDDGTDEPSEIFVRIRWQKRKWQCPSLSWKEFTSVKSLRKASPIGIIGVRVGIVSKEVEHCPREVVVETRFASHNNRKFEGRLSITASLNLDLPVYTEVKRTSTFPREKWLRNAKSFIRKIRNNLSNTFIISFAPRWN
jgi:hypothetical protein